VSELIIVKKLQEIMHGTVCMGIFTFGTCCILICRVCCLLVLSCLLCNCCWFTVCIVVVDMCVLLFHVYLLYHVGIALFFFYIRCRTAG